MKLILSDFDGTLTTKDSMFEFIKFTHGMSGFLKGVTLLSPWLAMMKLGIVSNSTAKQKLLTHFYKGKTKQELEKKGRMFSEQQLPKLLRPRAIEAIAFYKQQNARIVIVSASLDIWLSSFAKAQGLELICTQAKYEEGLFAGAFQTPNCNGLEKKNRVLQEIDLGKYSEVVALGDTKGDTQLLALADTPMYRPFHSY